MVSSSRKSTRSSTKSDGKCNEQSNNMKVVVRVRPFNELEDSENGSLIRIMDQNVLVFDPNEDCEAMDFPGSFKKSRNNLLQRRRRDLRFIFDRVFNERSTTTDVFEQTTKNIIDGVLNGYNCTAFAYGATGAGKTYTMLGNPETPGVTFLTMMDLYSRIDELKDEKTCDVAVSYLEVYNETIRDLLLPGPHLAVREDPTRGVCVNGLTLHKPRTAQELLGMLEFGNNNRTQHPTDANAQSSRSHAVFQVFVRQKDRTAGLQSNVRIAKMSLIDLAGSERAHVSTNRGARFREGANINKSLLALGNCIIALADKENKVGHIPYRDSKLTRLLKDSLGGNCRTVMIAAISPSSLSYEDTYNTLKYADRAKSIKVKLSKNVVRVDWHVSRYAKIVDELRTEVLELKAKLNKYEESDALVKKTPLRDDNRFQMDSLETSYQSIMSERAMIKRDQVDIEAAQRDLSMKAYRKERNLERIQCFCLDEEQRKTAAVKVQKCLSVTKTKKKKLETRILEAERKLKENTENLDRMSAEAKGLTNSSKELEQEFLRCQSSSKMELECTELRRQCRYFKKFTHAQEKDAQNTEKILTKVLTAFKNQFLVVKGAGLATTEMDNEYDSIVELINGGREVSWADQSIAENNLDVSNLHSITNDATLIESTRFDTPTTTIFSSLLSKKSSKLMMTPIRAFTPNHLVTNSDQKSPVNAEPRISLIQAFDAATTPLLPQRGNKIERAESSETLRSYSAKTLTPLRGQTRNTNTTTPLHDVRDAETSNATTVSTRKHVLKDAWIDLPERSGSSSSGVCSSSGELRISAFLTSSTTPKIPTADISTPLRSISINNCNTTQSSTNHVGRSLSNETPSKQVKLTENPPRKHATKPLACMMPKRMGSSKENLYPKTRPLKKATSTTNLYSNSSKNIQKHVSGLKRAISSSVLNASRNFAPRSTKEASTLRDRPRWQ